MTDAPVVEVSDDSTPPPVADNQKINDLADPAINSLDGFDPLIHAVDQDGQPKRKPDGTYSMKRGRKPGQTRTAPPKDGPMKTTVSPARAAAVESAMLFAYGGVSIFGDEWKPKSDAEIQGLENAFERYYVAKGIVEFPPTVGLVVALAAYSVPRLATTNTQTKLQKIGLWAKEKYHASKKALGK